MIDGKKRGSKLTLWDSWKPLRWGDEKKIKAHRIDESRRSHRTPAIKSVVTAKGGPGEGETAEHGGVLFLLSKDP